MPQSTQIKMYKLRVRLWQLYTTSLDCVLEHFVKPV